MNGPRGYYAKWNKSDRGRQIPYGFTYTWYLKHKTSDQTTKQKLTHRFREQTGGCQRRGSGKISGNQWMRLMRVWQWQSYKTTRVSSSMAMEDKTIGCEFKEVRDQGVRKIIYTYFKLKIKTEVKK